MPSSIIALIALLVLIISFCVCVWHKNGLVRGMMALIACAALAVAIGYW